jgi:hypothetical protein
MWICEEARLAGARAPTHESDVMFPGMPMRELKVER